MKNIMKIFVLLFVVGFMSSCEPDEYAKPDIDLTSISQVNNIVERDPKTGEFTVIHKKMVRLDIYKELPVLYVWNSDGIVTSYSTSDLIATDDEIQTKVSVKASENITVTDAEGNETEVPVYYNYSITYTKETGVCEIDVEKTDENGVVTSEELQGEFKETEVYN